MTDQEIERIRQHMAAEMGGLEERICRRIDDVKGDVHALWKVVHGIRVRLFEGNGQEAIAQRVQRTELAVDELQRDAQSAGSRRHQRRRDRWKLVGQVAIAVLSAALGAVVALLAG